MSDRPASPVGPPTRRERRAERTGARVRSASRSLTGFVLLVLYAIGGQTQVEGILLALCLGGLGVGIVLWAQELMSGELRIEERHPLGSGAEEVRGGRGCAHRRGGLQPPAGAPGRRWSARSAGLASALAIPVLSLGPAPGQEPVRDAVEEGRAPGRRSTDLAVPRGGIPPDGVVTVFPEGFAGNAEAQTLLINAGADRLQLSRRGGSWAPGGFVAYSKVCTHAGCPVGLYRAAQGELICPCHQSTFDVMRGAVPTFGPAARPLPAAADPA